MSRGPQSLVVLQSGGPSSTVNASLAGVLDCAHTKDLRVTVVQGGLVGLAERRTRMLGGTDINLTALADTPGCALISSRRPFTAEHQVAALALLRELGAGLIVVGGDGSMRGTSSIIDAGVGVVGVVNTCDNDVAGFDYTPGFPTCASRLAQWAIDAIQDCRSLGGFDNVAILEAMGRDVGWLAGATGALAYADVIVVPERPRALGELTNEIAEHVQRQGCALVVIAEGALEPGGRLLAEHSGEIPADQLGRPVVSLGVGPAMAVAQRLRQDHQLQSRVARPGVLQRSGRPLATDRDNAWALGEKAVELIAQGATGLAVGPGDELPFAGLAARPVPHALLDAHGIDVAAMRDAVGHLLQSPTPLPEITF